MSTIITYHLGKQYRSHQHVYLNSYCPNILQILNHYHKIAALNLCKSSWIVENAMQQYCSNIESNYLVSVAERFKAWRLSTTADEMN